MKVAAISDVHGNVPALEAVLAEIDRDEGLVEQLLDPPDPDETTAHFESLRGA